MVEYKIYVCDKEMMIKIYTDGAAKGNPGPGGYGIVLIAPDGRMKEISEGYKLTTNNRMELLAIIVGLEKLKKKPSNVTVYTDSKYVINAIEKKRVFRREKEGFKERKNTDLRKRFLAIYRQHNVSFVWIQGHTGDVRNEYCDKLAVLATQKNNLKEDEKYINEKRV